MKEIEVKAKVDSLESIISEIKRRGLEISEPKRQHDAIYVSDELPFDAQVKGRNFLRIRDEEGKIFLTLKQSLTNELDSLEHEVTINDKEKMHEMLLTMGWHKIIEVIKVRRKTHIGKIEICLDEVKELGYFVEAEKISDEDSVGVQKELWEIMKSLGINDAQQVNKGYDSLMYLKTIENNLL